MKRLMEQLRELPHVHHALLRSRLNTLGVFLKSSKTKEEVRAAAEASGLRFEPSDLPVPDVFTVHSPTRRINWYQKQPDTLIILGTPAALMPKTIPLAKLTGLDESERTKILDFFNRLNPGPK